MTYQNQTRESLVNLSISELRAICVSLSIPHRRSKEDCIADILTAQPQLIAQAEIEQTDDYLFHDDKQPANLPAIGDTHFIGGFLLRCAQVNSEYAVVWDVHDENNVVMGEVRMDWNCFWTHSMSLGTFATPQFAVVDLYESLLALVEEQAVARHHLPEVKPTLEVFATNRPNVYAVYSHKPGLESNRYEVDLTSESCTCPHYEHRHDQEGFKDKHIEAVKAALLVRTALLLFEEEMLLDKPFDELTRADWELLCEPELELIAA